MFRRSHLLHFLLIVAAALALSSCGPDEDDHAEHAYVSAPQVSLRDRVAAVYNKVGLVNNGERVRVLDRSNNRRFVKVRTASGQEGWMEQRYLVGEDIYNSFAWLTAENRTSPAQSGAITRRPVNLHVDPARNSPRLYQLQEGAKVDLLKRASTPRSGLKKPQPPKEKDDDDDEATKAEAKSAGDQTSAGAPEDPLEDWWLVRDQSNNHVGWMLGRMLDVDVPLEIAQYAEGQRIIAALVLNEVPTSPGSVQRVPQFAVLTSEARDGMPFDFNQVRIFTWNPAKTRYETAYRERLTGELPFKVAQQQFEREGTLPTFTLRARDKDGAVKERQYKLNGPIVRRVEASTKAPAGPAAKSGK